jgi:hypothetical protein
MFGFESSDELGCYRDQRWTGMVKNGFQELPKSKQMSAQQTKKEKRRQTLSAEIRLASL